MLHVFFQCRQSLEVEDWLLARVMEIDPTATQLSILSLDFVSDDTLCWIVVVTLHTVWTSRAKGRAANLDEIKAILKSEVETLSNTRHHNIYETALQYISM